MENKKTKLTISGNPKKSFKNFETSKNQGKKTVFIEKQSSRITKKGGISKSFGQKSPQDYKRGSPFKKNNFSKAPSLTSDFEKRKLAEQRATKRLKGDQELKDKKSKSSAKKRELKLTVSRALSDEIETKQRSLASVKRARQKEIKNATKDESQENLKPIKRDVNIP